MPDNPQVRKTSGPTLYRAVGSLALAILLFMHVGGAGGAPTQGVSSTRAGICDRTVQVREAILARVAATDCGTVTGADLAALTDALMLKKAGISMLRPGDFSGLTGLRGLVLTRNSLTELPADIFAGLVSLWSLKLTHNDLRTLPDGVFEGLVVLDTLDVEFNRLETLPAGIFDGLNLRFLGLEGNRLRALQLGAFDGLGGSLMLDLSHNGMESVASGVFAGLGELTFLDLSVNRLQTLPAGVFAGLNSMNSMWLDQNPGASFTFRMIVERVPGTDKIVVRVPEGAPFDMTTAIGATGGSLPAGVSQVTVGVGRTTSEEIEVVGLTGTTITLGAAPPVPTGPPSPHSNTESFYGVASAVDGPVVFGVNGKNSAPWVIGRLRDRELRVGDGGMAIGVAGSFSDPDGDALAFDGSSSAPVVASVSISGSTLTVTPEAAGTATITVTATDNGGSNQSAMQRFEVTVASDEPEGTLSVRDGTASESAASMVFDVSLSLAGASPVTVEYTTSDGSGTAGARAGSDYTATSGTLTFAAGTTARQILVPITHDTVQENTESFDLTLSNPHNAEFAGGGQTLRATGTIVDDDGSGGGGSGGGGSANRPPVIEREIPAQTLEAGEIMELDIRLNFYDRDQRALDYTVESADTSVATVEVDRNGVLTIRGIARGVTTITVTAADRRDERVSQSFRVTVQGPARVALFPSASDPLGREGFVRVINRSGEAGEVSVEAIDDSGAVLGTAVLSIAGNATAHFNSSDLEDGNPDKGLSGGVGSGEGNWRLLLDSELEFEVLSYIRTGDGFLTAMHDVAPSVGGAYRVAIFNPARNPHQVSGLRLVNPGDEDAEVTIEGTDDSGASSASEVSFGIPAGKSITLPALELEKGGEGLVGRLGEGMGKWRLRVQSDRPIVVMSLLESPTGHLTNLSTVPDQSRR